MRGQCFARRKLLGVDPASHFDCTPKTNGGSRGLSSQSALEKERTRHSQQDFAASWMIFTHEWRVYRAPGVFSRIRGVISSRRATQAVREAGELIHFSRRYF